MISNADLLDWTRSDTTELPTLRRLEQAAIAAIQKRTGGYYGVEDEIVDVIRYRGWPLQLASAPVGGVITTLERWDGSAWVEVATTDYYIDGRLVWQNSTSSVPVLTTPGQPNRFRATYDAGYTVNAADSDVWDAPADIKQAVLLLVSHWNENREAAVVGMISAEVLIGLDYLLQPHIPASV